MSRYEGETRGLDWSRVRPLHGRPPRKWLDKAIRPTLLKAVRKEITWEDFREYLEALEATRRDG